MPFGSWTLDRLQAYLNEQKKIPIKRSRIDEILLAEGLRGESRRAGSANGSIPSSPKRGGAGAALHPSAGGQGVVVCLDEMGPLPPRSRPGRRLVQAAPGVKPDGTPRPAERAKHPIESGSRARGGYIFGAFRPTTGEAFTRPYDHRRGKDWVDFLEHVEMWGPPEVERVYAVLDNLPTHRTTDVLLFALWHPRWEFVFQPKYAAYLNLIEPWWKVLKSLALREELRDLEGSLQGGPASDRLLEQTSAPVPLGQAPTSPRPAQRSRGRPSSGCKETCRMNHLADSLHFRFDVSL